SYLARKVIGLNQRLVILKLLLKHRIGDDQSHRRIDTLALVLALHGPDVLVLVHLDGQVRQRPLEQDRKSTRLNSSHVKISYAVSCLKKKIKMEQPINN